MFSSTMLLELAQWCAPFNFSPTVFPQINFFCCQSVKFSFCPRWWFIERSCSSEVVFTFPPLKQLLDTVWQVLIVFFLLLVLLLRLLVFPRHQSNNFEFSESLSLNACRRGFVVSLPGLLFTFLWILLLWSVGWMDRKVETQECFFMQENFDRLDWDTLQCCCF